MQSAKDQPATPAQDKAKQPAKQSTGQATGQASKQPANPPAAKAPAVKPVPGPSAKAPPVGSPAASPGPAPAQHSAKTPAPGAAAQQAPPDRPAPDDPPPGPPMARPARMKLRHQGLILSLILMVLLPFAVTCFYLWTIAEDQYSSVSGFTVRSEESSGASELIGGLAQLTGTSASSDGDILYEFILSQSLVRSIDEVVDLRAHFAAFWETDPAFALWPDASIEDLEWYWQRIVRIAFDRSSGLTEVRVLAFEPQIAQTIAMEILRQSQIMINQLNEQAREDAMRYARLDLEEAIARLKTAREALTAFRLRTQIVDPDADLQGRMGVINNLQQQLAQALIELDLLRETASDSDPRISQAQRKIDVIRDRIRSERTSFATETTENSPTGENYPTLIAEYEGLVVDREFAEESYRAALAALDIARAQAQRQSRYLATYVHPTLAETSEFPRRLSIAGITGLFLLLSWSVLVLIYYSLRDRQ